MVEFELFGLVRVQCLPLSLALVPLQLVAGDGRAIVLRGIPAQSETALGTSTHFRREGCGRWTGWEL